jgi:hypothetical protein
MSILYKIEAELGLIYYIGSGLATGTEMLGAETRASQDPSRQSQMKIIIDMSNAEIDLSMSDLYETLTVNRGRMEKGQEPEMTAIVSRSRFAPILENAFRLVSKGLPLKFGVFTTLPDAVTWLELSAHESKILEIQHELRNDLRATI